MQEENRVSTCLVPEKEQQKEYDPNFSREAISSEMQDQSFLLQDFKRVQTFHKFMVHDLFKLEEKVDYSKA